MKKSNPQQQKQIVQSIVPELVITTKSDLAIFIQTAVRDAVSEAMADAPRSELTEDTIMIKDAAKLLGFSLHTLHDKCSRKELPFDKRGRRLYFSRAALKKWIRTGEK